MSSVSGAPAGLGSQLASQTQPANESSTQENKVQNLQPTGIPWGLGIKAQSQSTSVFGKPSTQESKTESQPTSVFGKSGLLFGPSSIQENKVENQPTGIPWGLGIKVQSQPTSVFGKPSTQESKTESQSASVFGPKMPLQTSLFGPSGLFATQEPDFQPPSTPKKALQNSTGLFGSLHGSETPQKGVWSPSQSSTPEIIKPSQSSGLFGPLLESKTQKSDFGPPSLTQEPTKPSQSLGLGSFGFVHLSHPQELPKPPPLSGLFGLPSKPCDKGDEEDQGKAEKFINDLMNIYCLLKYWFEHPSIIDGTWEEGIAIRKVQRCLKGTSFRWKERSKRTKIKEWEKGAMDILRAELYPLDTFEGLE
jgi:hypothetical protein